ncbi:MAG: hypothetical protein DRN15_07805 [Thermoprotei archaeon]|nr:MAG: hypothetical protein DRN15_07805 [Thermoprotei archaeon]RLF25422.1 MAG: hypothetical protein DRM97_01830 [Thermoprotei archaeon]
MVRITRTVIVPSIILTKRKYEILKELVNMYKVLLVEAVDYASRNYIKSFTGLKKHLYYKFRQRYPQLPSHYIHTICQDACTRVKSFIEKRVEDLTEEILEEIKRHYGVKLSRLSKEERKVVYRIVRKIARYQVEREMRDEVVKPKVKRISIWLDDHLWKTLGYTTIKMATHKGWIAVELKPHKLFWKYINSTWKLRTQPKIKLDARELRIYVYFVLEKEIKTYKPIGYLAVDVNENNVTILVDNVAIKFITLMRNIIVRYYKFRIKIQRKFTMAIGKRSSHYTSTGEGFLGSLERVGESVIGGLR